MKRAKKKIIPFEKGFSWKIINEDNYKEFCNKDDKSLFIITGKMSKLMMKHSMMN